MNTKQETNFETGKKYLLSVFYNFKTGPHESTYLGNSEFDEEEKDFFKGEGTQSGKYFALRNFIIFLDSPGHTELPLVQARSDLSEEELENSELIIEVDGAGNISRGLGKEFTQSEKGKLVEILNKLGENLPEVRTA